MSGSEFLVRSATMDDASAIAEVHVASWQSAYRDILPAELLSTLNVERRTEAWRRVLEGGPGSVLLATTTDQDVLGFCHVGPNRGAPTEFLGEVYAIYLLQHARRRGVGRDLFTRATDVLRSRAHPSFLVWVLDVNLEARRFYERLGGRLVAEKSIEIASRPFREVAYGWLEP